MWKKPLSILFTLVLVYCFANTSISFAHTATIEISGDNRYKSVRLVPQIYNASNSDLSDLLIKNSKGENVPYFLNTSSKKVHTNRETYPMKLINSYVKDNSFLFDYKLAAIQKRDMVSTSIEFTTKNTNFAKEVGVYGSHDNIHWDYIQKDKIYSIDDKPKLAINFMKPQKFTHYRLKLANNLEQISFDTVNLIHSTEEIEKTYFIENIEPKYNVESKNKKTTIIIEDLKNLRLCDVTIHTDSMFKRNAQALCWISKQIVHSISKDIYSLSLNGTSYADTTIPLDWYIPYSENYSITIVDADDKPITINSITARYYADEVVFEGTAGEVYTLEFGRDATKTAPVYDIARYKDDVLKGAIDKAAIGVISYTAEKNNIERDYKPFFNIVVTAVALLLGIVILLKLKK